MSPISPVSPIPHGPKNYPRRKLEFVWRAISATIIGAFIGIARSAGRHRFRRRAER
jgi:hypothetical protein